MKLLLLLVICFVVACTSVENIPKFNQSLNQEQLQLRQVKKEMERRFPIYHGQLEVIKEKVGDRQFASFNKLQASFDGLSKNKQTFDQRSNRLFLRTKDQRQAWGNRREVTSKDSEWNSLSEFKKYSKSEYKSLLKIVENYKKEENVFNLLVTSKKIKPYTDGLPTTRSQAYTVLKAIEQRRAYKAYNKSLLMSLKEKAKTTAVDFSSLIKFSNFDRFANNKKREFSGRLNSRAKPSDKTYQQARIIISEVLNKNISGAAKDYANAVNSVQDAANKLRPIGRQYLAYLPQYLSRDKVTSINTIFDLRKNKIIEEFIAKEIEKTNEQLKTKKTVSEHLKALVVIEDKFLKQYAFLNNEKQAGQYVDLLQKKRIEYLEYIEPSLLESIKSANSLNTLSNPLRGLLAKRDSDLPVVKRINQARQNQFKSLTAFKPAVTSSDVGVGSFSSEGLNYESELLAIYLGDFRQARLDRNTIALSVIFRDYLEAYGRYCSNYLPANKVMMTRSVCATEQVTTNGWGVETDRKCVRWVDKPIGIYADPVLYNVSNRVSSRAKMKATDKMLGSIFSNPFSVRTLGDEAVSAGDDMARLVRKNQCNNWGLEHFENNLYRFATNQTPLLLPGKETLASFKAVNTEPLVAARINFAKLLNDLIADNAKTWAINRYQRNSVANVSVSKSADQTPTRVSASYRFNVLGQVSRGDVRLSFKNGFPECLYFSDAPSTCRKASRGVINRYEKGQYNR